MIFGEAAENNTRAAYFALLFRFFRPRVSQRDSTVPNLFLRRRIRIEREIAKALKLIAFFGTRIRKCAFAFCVRYFERIRIDECFEIALRPGRAGAVGGGGIRLGNGEKPIILTDFCINCVRRAHPMDRSFDFPARCWTT